MAHFVGTENFLASLVVARDGDVCQVRCDGHDFHVHGTCAPGTPVFLCLRPEALLLSTAALPASSAQCLPGPCRGAWTPRGRCAPLRLDAGVELRIGTMVVASFKAAAAHLLERALRS